MGKRAFPQARAMTWMWWALGASLGISLFPEHGRELARLAFSDARKLFEWTESGVKVLPSAALSDDEAAAVVEVSETRTADGGTIRVKLADKRQALMDLARICAMIPEPERRVRIIKSVADMSDEELAAVVSGEDQPANERTTH